LTGYVIDDAAVIAGLAAGAEAQRRELSRLLHSAYDGGPSLHIPALCLVAVAGLQPSLADHIAILVTEAANGVVDIPGLAAGQINHIVAEFPGLGLAAAHAASEAINRDAIIVTTDAERYNDLPVHAIEL
jgi:hypothetical protein